MSRSPSVEAPRLGAEVTVSPTRSFRRLGIANRTGRVVGFEFASDRAIVKFPHGIAAVSYEDIQSAEDDPASAWHNYRARKIQALAANGLSRRDFMAGWRAGRGEDIAA